MRIYAANCAASLRKKVFFKWKFFLLNLALSLFIFLLSAGALERGLAAEGDKVGGGRDQAPGTGQTSRERKSASTSGESQAQT